MPPYRCSLHGTDFVYPDEPAKNRIGFYTTRWVEADSPETAEIMAVDVIRQDSYWKHLQSFTTAPLPTIYVEEIVEVKNVTGPNKGYTFYRVDPNED